MPGEQVLRLMSSSTTEMQSGGEAPARSDVFSDPTYVPIYVLTSTLSTTAASLASGQARLGTAQSQTPVVLCVW